MINMNGIKIAVASGKGGTGKTMVSTSLAASLAAEHQVQFLDCDVEAPNAHLFIKPKIQQKRPAVIMVPEIDEAKCTHCGQCVKGCAFNALAQINKKILLFPQLCHGCGNCSLLCPENAITEKPREIGWLSAGRAQFKMEYFMGELTVSEPMPTPIIRQLKAMMKNESEVTILDSPPGASCAVVATINDADFVLLVTEPTPFGLHDLKQMLGIIETMKTPAGVIINREGIGDDAVKKFILGTNYPILMEIPYQQKIASELAKGNILSKAIPVYQQQFLNLYQQILILLERTAGLR
jgi:MinD superfamily P-loop ATPase